MAYDNEPFANSSQSDLRRNDYSTYISSQCGYEVKFPGQYIIEDVYSHSVVVENAVLEDQHTHMRTECIPFNDLGDNQNNNDFLYHKALAYAQHQGFDNPEIKIKERSRKKTVELRGYKEVAGHPATFQVIMHLDNSSIFVMIAGAPSRYYPNKLTSFFFNNVKSIQ